MKAVIGIDEVGRGPIAGPVALGAFLMRGSITSPVLGGKKIPLRDSKKLSRVQREIWYKHLVAMKNQGLCDFSVVMISAASIDAKGIAPSIRLALARSLRAIAPDVKTLVLLDGGLKAPDEYKNQKTIIKGDEKEQAIACASIVAKVTRDRYMFRQAKKYPEYGFENHVGYGTKAHYAAIKQHGLLGLHRRSFVKKLLG